MTRDRLIDALRAQLTDYLFFGEASEPIAPDDDLFELGLDSQGVTRLVAWAADVAGVRIADADVTADHFRSLNALAELIGR